MPKVYVHIITNSVSCKFRMLSELILRIVLIEAFTFSNTIDGNKQLIK